MNGSIALGWLLATVLFALLGDAWMTVAFFVFAVLFGLITINNNYQGIKEFVIREDKGETDES